MAAGSGRSAIGRNRRFAAVLLALFWAASAATLSGAPFAQWLDAKAPDGRTVRIWGEGDEYSAVFESEDGRTVVYDESAGGYAYADKDAQTGALVSTGVRVGGESGVESRLAAIRRHLRDTSAAAVEERRRRIREHDEATGTTRRWEALKASARASRRRLASASNVSSPDVPEEGRVSLQAPTHRTTGTIVGLALLIDFPSENGSGATLAQQAHPSVTKGDLDSLFNAESFTKFGNTRSVRKYFKDVSSGCLNYTNIVIGWFKMPYPRSHYDNTSVGCGDCARPLVVEAFRQMRADSAYRTKYEPLLRRLTLGDYSAPKAVNVYFAGEPSSRWNYGLWAHRAGFYGSNFGDAWYTVDGDKRSVLAYQITPITSEPAIGTLCHENGHMICDFPDLYPYEGSIGGVGKFCLMDGSVVNSDPQGFCAYLRAAAGWISPNELSAVPGRRTVTCSRSDVWKWGNPKNDREYFLIENRRKSGVDASLPAEGVLIWRCNESRSNTSATYLPAFSETSARWRMSNEVSLEQADGSYTYEQSGGKGAKKDLWHVGNPSVRYTGRFNDESTPCAKWEDGSDSGLRLADFSAAGDTMSFYVGDAHATVDVAFDAVGGSVDRPSIRYVVGRAYGHLPTPVRRGFRFVGWEDSSSGVSVTVADLASTSVTALSARWRQVSQNDYPDIDFGKGNDSWPTELFLASSAGATSAKDLFGADEPVLLYLGYRNAGFAETGGGFTVRMAVYDLSHRRLGGSEYRQKASLAGGSSTWSWGGASFSFLNALAAGQYVLRVELDADQEIAEYDEENNVMEFGFTVGNGYFVTYASGMHYCVGDEGRVVVSGSGATTLAGVRFTRTGHDQTGWSTSFEGDRLDYGLGGRYYGTSSITLFPYWTAKTYLVRFDANGGSVSPGSASVTYGRAYGPLPTPVRDGHVFLGWFTSPIGGTQISESTVATGGATYYAQWFDPNGYTIVFMPSADAALSQAASQGVKVGKVAKLNPCAFAAPAGKKFAGWRRADNGRRYDDGVMVFNLAEPGETVKLTAIWE